MANGVSSIVQAPAPQISSNTLLISTTMSLISAGTERMLVDFGKASYLSKARQQPEKVKEVLNKVKTEGLLSTIDAVRSKLSQPIPLGYCNVGVVSEAGNAVQGLKRGDRVVSNGPHGDLVKVPKNLCVRIPPIVDDESAVFTVLASIGLQGIRLAAPTLGESFVVVGVGLIGLLTVQLLKAQGCRVLAIDVDKNRLQLAQDFGAATCHVGGGEDPISMGFAFTQGRGVDAVIITASTSSNDLVSQAAKMSRKRGRIILVGVTGLALNRSDFYEKELTFQVSCSYGPGRYDPVYEEQGIDYPIGFVRWTEQRNFEAILDLMATGQLDVKPLITHRYLFEEAVQAYQTLAEDKTALGIVLTYDSDRESRELTDIVLLESVKFDPMKPIVGCVGAGNYASRVLIPALKTKGAQLHTIVTSGGVSGAFHGGRAGFSNASTDLNSILRNVSINTMVIATRHDTHAQFVCNGLVAGKHVFVEKPLAIRLEELADVEAAYHMARIIGKTPCLMIGFNRRFAPQVKKMKSLLQSVKEPKTFIMTVNAGVIPKDHWAQDRDEGGGRIVGEACHFIDLMYFLAGSEITSIEARKMGQAGGISSTQDTATITLGFLDGSIGTIHYLTNGAKSFSKERIEVFTAQRILQLNDFRKLKGFGWPTFHSMNLWRQDKGQAACITAFLEAIEHGAPSPISPEEIFTVARVSIEAAEMIRLQ